MKRLGISIYPSQEDLAKTLAYIDMAARYGFTRIFTCLLSEEGVPLADTVAHFRAVTAKAKEHGMEVIADVAPEVFDRYDVSYKNLRFFSDLGLAGIRLDTGFSGLEESIMTLNPYGLKIELNISNGTRYLANIMSHVPNAEKIVGCHNFYPHRYTGLDYEHFLATTRQYKKYGIHTSAFVSSEVATHGPWLVNEGLCTLEQHRDLPIDVQAKHLWATGLIDDVIIANAFAAEEELARLATLHSDMLTLRLEVESGASDIEYKILFDELHFSRGDVSAYMIRSTQPRVKYKDEHFPAWNTPELRPGDVVIESSLYARYAGELQIVRRPMANSGRTNVVARVVEAERFLIDLIKPWQKFRFTE